MAAKITAYYDADSTISIEVSGIETKEKADQIFDGIKKVILEIENTPEKCAARARKH
jgi:hypothetical protein